MRDLGDKNFLMLRNHGLLTVGETVPDAFLFMYLFESRLHDPGPRAGRRRARARRPADHRGRAGAGESGRRAAWAAALAWPGLLRKLDRVDPGYKE